MTVLLSAMLHTKNANVRIRFKCVPLGNWQSQQDWEDSLNQASEEGWTLVAITECDQKEYTGANTGVEIHDMFCVFIFTREEQVHVDSQNVPNAD